jgi:hypothetical protein
MGSQPRLNAGSHAAEHACDETIFAIAAGKKIHGISLAFKRTEPRI